MYRTTFTKIKNISDTGRKGMELFSKKGKNGKILINGRD